MATFAIMTASTTPPLHILRGILRKIKHSQHYSNNLLHSSAPATTIGHSGDTTKNLKNHILEQYRLARTASPQKAFFLRKMAYDFHTLQKDLTERARLYELDSGAEKVLTPKELSKRAAARSGLQLPKLYEAENTK